MELSKRYIYGSCTICGEDITIVHDLRLVEEEVCSRSCRKKKIERELKKVTNAELRAKHGDDPFLMQDYANLHSKMRELKPKPSKCSNCGQNIHLELANLSEQYLDDPSDFAWMCESCHRKYDERNGVEKETKAKIKELYLNGMKTSEIAQATATHRFRVNFIIENYKRTLSYGKSSQPEVREVSTSSDEEKDYCVKASITIPKKVLTEYKSFCNAQAFKLSTRLAYLMKKDLKAVKISP